MRIWNALLCECLWFLRQTIPDCLPLITVHTFTRIDIQQNKFTFVCFFFLLLLALVMEHSIYSAFLFFIHSRLSDTLWTIGYFKQIIITLTHGMLSYICELGGKRRHRSFSNSSLDYLLIPNNTAINYFIFTFQIISVFDDTYRPFLVVVIHCAICFLFWCPIRLHVIQTYGFCVCVA